MVRGASHVLHISKADDDTFLNLPALESKAKLASFGCAPQLYYGSMAIAGYNPNTFAMCGITFSHTARPDR
eukprot:58540-Prymnesium_polylepis.1